MYSKCRTIFVCCFFFLTCLIPSALFCELNVQKFSAEESILPLDHPIKDKLDQIFKDPVKYFSPTALRKNGFNVFKRIRSGLMVISHPEIEGYLFKKFKSNIPEKDQTKNFLQRINGARALAQFIHVNDLKYIIVPKKWLYRLPESSSKSKTPAYILVVEKMDILPWGRTHDCELAQRYLNMQKDVLNELCLVTYHFRGLDSAIHNMPFTYQDKIAFVDTEKWKIKRNGILKKAMPFLNDEMQKYAREIFDKLDG